MKKHKIPSFAFSISAVLLLSILNSSSVQAAPKKLTIESVGDTMTWKQTKLQVKAGEEVELTIKNNSKSSALEHNWVLTKPGTDAAVATAGLSAGAEKGWFTLTPDVLAHSEMIKPGQKAVLKFKAPAAAGNYPYVCTFPGHSAMMKGVLEVK